MADESKSLDVIEAIDSVARALRWLAAVQTAALITHPAPRDLEEQRERRDVWMTEVSIALDEMTNQGYH